MSFKCKKIVYRLQSVIQNFRAAFGIFKKGHFWGSFTHKYIKTTLFLEERAPLCQILLGAASDYRTLISFGLFLELTLFVVRYKRIVTLTFFIDSLKKRFVAFESAFLRKTLPTFSCQECKKRAQISRHLFQK